MKGIILLPFVVAALVGCAARAPAPVSDRSHELRESSADYREVIAGDTLYSIAWESGRDFRELADWNNIAPPFTIHPGQKLRLIAPAPKQTPANTAVSGSIHVVEKGETLYSIAREAGVSARELAAWNNLTPPYTLRVNQKLRTARTQTAPTPARPDKPARPKQAEKPGKQTPPEPVATGGKSPAAATATIKAGTWTWPAEGALIDRYSKSGGNKGIDLAGKRGQAISAANEGRVVYQGGGLRGYGQLIIVKHSAEFLSAYAHCDRIYVREGDVVKRGQKIADMGATGTDRVKLHFEIRYRGSPVDPLQYLPRK